VKRTIVQQIPYIRVCADTYFLHYRAGAVVAVIVW